MRCILFLLLLAELGFAQHCVELNATQLVMSDHYDNAVETAKIKERIIAGVYDNRKVLLCRTTSESCVKHLLDAYKIENENAIILKSGDWESYPDFLKEEIVASILYDTWGHPMKPDGPLSVVYKSGQSPFDYLNPESKMRFGSFSKPDYLQGGKGADAYGPNCWYSSISAIVDKSSSLARNYELHTQEWRKNRFMGAAEFRCHMQNFVKVDNPEFGDIVRYYTDSIYYDPSNEIYHGEVHAAVFIGRDSIGNIVLTKNGRSDLNFLVFQYELDVDRLYFSPSRVKKGYFRLQKGRSFMDPSTDTTCSCYKSYQVDMANYTDRFKCLANRITPRPCNNVRPCYCYPEVWATN